MDAKGATVAELNELVDEANVTCLGPLDLTFY